MSGQNSRFSGFRGDSTLQPGVIASATRRGSGENREKQGLYTPRSCRLLARRRVQICPKSVHSWPLLATSGRFWPVMSGSGRTLFISGRPGKFTLSFAGPRSAVRKFISYPALRSLFLSSMFLSARSGAPLSPAHSPLRTRLWAMTRQLALGCASWGSKLSKSLGVINNSPEHHS